MNKYLVVLERSSTGWGAWSPDLGVYATGQSKEETVDRVRGAIAFHVAGLREAGDVIPDATTDSVLVGA